ncbi:hypothetical protein CMI42_05725 [Candidatus Pacearchaeota archaeon]|jgi:ABC-type antimicrobial peptide transport system permease subunit|nr:hypothetical protein [Candidatus Pacearchaeota archaeon]|tara:strand:- start:514 stop:828 length:315 start_codon:yes stop_codon:yes gene_type:complete
MKKPKKIKVLNYAIFQTLIMALVGLLAGILYSFSGLVIDMLVTLGWITTNETPGLSYGTLLAFGALIGMPFYFALFGFITGIIGAFLYNLFARSFSRVNTRLFR